MEPPDKITLEIVKKLYSLLLLLFIFSAITGQTVHVVDGKTGMPIEGVLLFTAELSTQTNENGEASIDIFPYQSTIHFKHSSFLPYITTKEKVKKQGTVLLTEDPVKLDEVVVSVSRWKQSKADIPHTIKSISTEDILHFNPQTTADLLGTKGGVFIQKSQMGGGSPMIRGFAANRVLIVVDGIRMNNAIYRSGNLQNVISLDVNSLENAEVVFGPGSVNYGSDAVGGVMCFTTQKPKLSTSEKREHSGKLFSRYSSANFEKTISGTYTFGSKKWATFVSSTYTKFNDLRMGTSGPEQYLRPEYISDNKFTGTDNVIQNKNSLIQKYTGYSQLNILGKIRFRPNENIDFIISAHHSQTLDIPRYDRLIQYKNKKLKYAKWFYGPQKWTLVSGKAEYKKENILFDKLVLLAGYQNYSESRHDRKLNSEHLRNRTENVAIFSANLDFVKSFDKQSTLFYGLEANTNRVNSTGTSEDLLAGVRTKIASRYPNGSTYRSMAGYYSFKYILSSQFIFHLGSRFTYTHLKGEFDKQFYNFPFDGFNLKNSAFNGNLGVVWHPTKEWQINIHTATGFRSPNIDDVAKVFDSEPGNVIVPNPELKPEYARNVELNIIRSYVGKAKIEITGFYTWLKDAMVRRNFELNGQDSIMYDGVMSNVEALINAESAIIYGANFTFEYIITNVLRTHNNFTVTKGKDSDGLPVRHVPPVFGSSHLIYEKQKLFFDLYVDYSGKLENYELAKSEQAKPHIYLPDENGRPYSPSWYTINLKSNYKINQKFMVGGGVENILDKRYRAYSSGMISPGINFIVSLNAKF